MGLFKKEPKIQVLTYECKYCKLQRYFRTIDEYSTKCKLCGREMVFVRAHDYNPKTALGAVKAASQISRNKRSNTSKSQPSKPEPKCPICGSTNLSKITLTKRAVKTGLFGFLGAVDDAGKTYQCNECKSKF